MTRIEIETADGVCPSYVFRPATPQHANESAWPAALVFMDGLGIRPAILAVGERLASYGYFVLLPDLFYRAGPYEPMNAKEVFSNPDKIKELRTRFLPHVSPGKIMSDTRAFLDCLGAQPDVQPGPIGTTGYCMGGTLSLTAAGTYPDRIAAAASFYGGQLATDAPDSPHLLAPKMKARVYVAGAIEDQRFPDDMKARLEMR